MNLQIFVVPNILDIEDDNTKSSQRTVNITGQDYGYLVIHKNYRQGIFLANRNWALNFVGFNQSGLRIDFEKVEIKDKNGVVCHDYPHVSTLKHTIYVQVSFTFLTNRRTKLKGF